MWKKWVNWSHQSVARFCKLALGPDAALNELTHGYHNPSMFGMRAGFVRSN
jgi:hypothetical protein